MEYQALYRRWRPRGFDDFVGQKHIVTTLSNAILNDRIAHAYLLTGPRGTGKTSTAKILAKALNCQNLHDAEPCDQCSNCKRINEGTFLDVLEIDGASNRGIDEIRDLREKIKFAPAEGKYKIYIIDEVHMLTMEAFNALLKTLEEPPKFVVFILATTEVYKLPATILSRCQRFDFKRFTLEEIKGRLEQILQAENVQYEEKALDLVAKHAEGGMRDALSLLEQCISHSEDMLLEKDVRALLGLIEPEEIQKIAIAIKEQKTQVALKILTEVTQDGKDVFQFGQSLVEYFRNQLLASLSGTPTVGLSVTKLLETIQLLAAATNDVKRSYRNTLPLELALIKLTTEQATRDELEERLTKLERLLENHKTTPMITATIPETKAEIPEAPIKPAEASNEPVLKPIVEATPSESTNNQKSKPVAPQATANIETTDIDWNGFLTEVKGRKMTTGALLQEGKPVHLTSTELLIEFSPNMSFHVDNLNKAENINLLSEAFESLYNRKVRIICALAGSSPKKTEALKPNVPEESAKPELQLRSETDALQSALSVFGGKTTIITKEEK